MAATSAATTHPLRTDFAQLIDGELIAGTPALDVINPANGAVFARAPRAGVADLDRARGARLSVGANSRSLSAASISLAWAQRCGRTSTVLPNC